MCFFYVNSKEVFLSLERLSITKNCYLLKENVYVFLWFFLISCCIYIIWKSVGTYCLWRCKLLFGDYTYNKTCHFNNSLRTNPFEHALKNNFKLQITPEYQVFEQQLVQTTDSHEEWRARWCSDRVSVWTSHLNKNKDQVTPGNWDKDEARSS